MVARDHGTPVAFETLRFVTVVIADLNDNDPMFPPSQLAQIRFTVPEETATGYLVGRVEAKDADEGKNGRVYYYIVQGNEERWFSVDKTYGNIYTKKRLDRSVIAKSFPSENTFSNLYCPHLIFCAGRSETGTAFRSR